MKNFLHHNPTEGGDEQQGIYNDIYGDTLKFYEKIFGEKAPEDIWEPPKNRFEPELLGHCLVDLHRLCVYQDK